MAAKHLAAYAARNGLDDAQLAAYCDELRRIYAEHGSQAAATRFGYSTRTALRHLHALGAPIRPRGGPTRLPPRLCAVCGEPVELRGRKRCRKHTPAHNSYPPPTPRVCALDGCEVVFTPQPVKLSRGAGRFHSYGCWNQWRRGKPQREWRNVP